MSATARAVVALGGLPGSGKSTLARAVAATLTDARVLDKDVVRHSLFHPCDYSAAERTITFSAMLEAGRYHLGRGRTVIVDGMPFYRRQELDALSTMAREAGAGLAVVVCDVPVELAARRCEEQLESGTHTAANRSAQLVRRVASEMEEPATDYLTVDTTGTLDDALRAVLAYLGELTRVS